MIDACLRKSSDSDILYVVLVVAAAVMVLRLIERPARAFMLKLARPVP